MCVVFAYTFYVRLFCETRYLPTLYQWQNIVCSCLAMYKKNNNILSLFKYCLQLSCFEELKIVMGPKQRSTSNYKKEWFCKFLGCLSLITININFFLFFGLNIPNEFYKHCSLPYTYIETLLVHIFRFITGSSFSGHNFLF